MLPFSFSFDVGVQIIGCLICIGWTVVATIIFFRRCTISDDRIMHKQESLLSTGIKLFSNPLTTAIFFLYVVYAMSLGFGQLTLVATFNYDVLTSNADSGAFILVFSIITAVFFVPLVNYYFTTGVSKGEWMLMNKVADWSLKIVGILVLVLIFASSVNYKNASTPGFVLYVILQVVYSCMTVLLHNGLSIVLRKGCLADLSIRGVDSFAQFNAVVFTGVYICNGLAKAISLAIIDSSGYSQNDDDKVDDGISARYSVTQNAILCMVLITTIPCIALFALEYFIAKRCCVFYSKVEDTKFEEDAQRAMTRNDSKVTIEMQANSPIHSDGEAGRVTVLENGRPQSHRTIELNEALSQLTDNELNCLVYRDTAKRDAYKFFVKYAHYLTLIFSVASSILSLIYVVLSIIYGVSGLPIVVIVFVLNSVICFYEMLKHGPLTRALVLSTHENFKEIIDEMNASRVEYRRSINKTFELAMDDDVVRSGKTHMTKDKLVKSFIMSFSLLSLIVFTALIARVS